MASEVAVAPEQFGRLLTVEPSLRVTHQQPLLDLGAAPLGEAPIFTVDGEAVVFQHPLGGDVVLECVS